MNRAEKIELIKQLNPEDYYFDKIERNIEILEGKLAIQFKNRFYPKSIVYFVIEDEISFSLYALLYRNKEGEATILNSSLNDNEKEMIKDIWEKFFKVHNQDPNMKSIRIRYLLNSQ